MAGKLTNCARCRQHMPNAASASLADDTLAAFNAHLCGCAACQNEFRRVQTALQEIDHTLSASLAAEPSAQLVANVLQNIRQDVNSQPHRATAWTRWRAWLTAAGVCTAIALVFFAARISHKLNPPLHDAATVQTSDPSTTKLIPHPNFKASVDASATQSRKPAPMRVLHASLRTTHKKAAEPQVIVQPGQMQAILRFAAAMQRGQIDGAQFLAGQRAINEPIEIKPLPITPLKIEPLDGDSVPPNSTGGSEGSEKDSVSGHSNWRP